MSKCRSGDALLHFLKKCINIHMMYEYGTRYSSFDWNCVHKVTKMLQNPEFDEFRQIIHLRQPVEKPVETVNNTVNNS